VPAEEEFGATQRRKMQVAMRRHSKEQDKGPLPLPSCRLCSAACQLPDLSGSSALACEALLRVTSAQPLSVALEPCQQPGLLHCLQSQS
jgi:hypothetical protein